MFIGQRPEPSTELNISCANQADRDRLFEVLIKEQPAGGLQKIGDRNICGVLTLEPDNVARMEEDLQDIAAALEIKISVFIHGASQPTHKPTAPDA